MDYQVRVTNSTAFAVYVYDDSLYLGSVGPWSTSGYWTVSSGSRFSLEDLFGTELTYTYVYSSGTLVWNGGSWIIEERK